MSRKTEKCIICRKELTSKQILHNAIVCSEECAKAFRRVYSAIHYLVKKPYYSDFMKKYYIQNAKKLKLEKLEAKEEASYNREKKNIIRKKIVEYINNYGCNKILTLESSEFIFSKELPSKKIYVYEYVEKIYKAMKKNKPSNVSVFYGDIGEFADFQIGVDCVYLDFCDSINSNIESIKKLRDVLKSSKLFAITIAINRYFSSNEVRSDYQIETLKQIQDITNISYKPLFGLGYKDKGSMPMLTLVLENIK